MTINPFLAYVKDTVNHKLKAIPACVISDHLVHDTQLFWSFHKIIAHDLIKQLPN